MAEVIKVKETQLSSKSNNYISNCDHLKKNKIKHINFIGLSVYV